MRRIAIGLGVIATMAAGLVAVGGPSGAASKSPIVIYNFSPVNVAQTASQPGVTQAMAVATAYYNKKGGINGHPIVYKFCDDQESPTVTTQCADAAVSNKAVAMLNPYENVPNYLPVLKKAGISVIDVLALSPGAFTYSNSYVIASGAFGQSFGAGDVLKKAGFKKVAFLESQLPATAAVGAAFLSAAKATGVTIQTIPVPGTLTTLSSVVSQVGSDDAAYLLLPPTQVLAYMQAAKQQGVKATIIADSGLLQASQITQTGGASSPAEGSIIAGSFPDASSPSWKTFKTAIKQYKGTKKDVTINNVADAGSWVSTSVFVQVAKTIKGNVTAASFQKALKKSSAVTTGGLTPTLNFTKPFSNPTWKQLFNTGVYFQTVKNGKFAVYTKVPSIDTAANFKAS